MNKGGIEVIYSLANSISEKYIDENNGQIIELLPKKEALRIIEGSVKTALKIATQVRLDGHKIKLEQLLLNINHKSKILENER
jgi:hypothetical protein